MNRLNEVIAAILFCLILLHFILYWYKCGHLLYSSVFLFGGVLMGAISLSIMLNSFFNEKRFYQKMQWLPMSFMVMTIVIIIYLILSWDIKSLSKAEKEFLKLERKQ